MIRGRMHACEQPSPYVRARQSFLVGRTEVKCSQGEPVDGPCVAKEG